MDEKLKELTEFIVKEGVDLADEKAAGILGQAKQDANEILHRARKEADDTVSLAQKRADEIRKNAESELKLASQQILSNLKQKITDLLLVEMLEEPLNKSFVGKDFLGKLVLEIVKNWDPKADDTPELKVLISEEQFEDVNSFLKQNAADILKKGLKIDVDKTMQSGFQISPVDGSFKLNFSESEFVEFFKTFLRTKTQSLLFEGK